MLCTALALSACSAAMPGYQPSPLKPSAVSRFKGQEAGKVDEGGRYVLSEDEAKLPCKRMVGIMQITIARQRGRAAEASNPPSSLSALFGGTSTSAELVRERAKLNAFNERLAEQGCPTLDIDAEIASAPDGPKKY
jgi:hypothetical protein